MSPTVRGLGYVLPTAPADHDDLHDRFAWRLDPDRRYNAADAALTGAADGSRARPGRRTPDDDGDGASPAWHRDPGDPALDFVAADDSRHRFDYGDLAGAAAALAAGLSGIVDAGDRVAVRLPQCPEHVCVHLAAYRLGATVVPVSMLAGREGVRHRIAGTDPAIYLVDAAVSDPVADGSGSGTRAERVRVARDGASPLGGLSGLAGDAGAAPPRAATSPDDPALVLYTSGTSGAPKGVLAPHRYLAGSLPAFHCYFGLFDPADARAARVYSPSEWAWAGALFDVLLPTLSVGGTVCARERREGFDPDRALAFAARTGVTHAFLPPTALGRLRAEADPTAHDHALSTVMCGGEELPPALAAWAERELGVTVNESYGQTEANGLVGECELYDCPEGAMGRPYPGHDVRVVDDEGTVRAAGERGEIAVPTDDPSLFLGYLDAPGGPEGERFRTGDLARRDAEGNLRHEGRRDELILTSGYRVSPLEVERVLAGDPAVADAVAGGVDDPERGQRIVAVVRPVPDPGSGAGEADARDREALRERLVERVRDALGPHKVPREVRFVGDLPETRSGKADRAALFGEEWGDEPGE